VNSVTIILYALSEPLLYKIIHCEGEVVVHCFLFCFVFSGLSGLQSLPDVPPNPTDTHPGPGTGGDCAIPKPRGFPDLRLSPLLHTSTSKHYVLFETVGVYFLHHSFTIIHLTLPTSTYTPTLVHTC